MLKGKKRNKNFQTRVLSLVIAFMMLFSLMPSSLVSAESNNDFKNADSIATIVKVDQNDNPLQGAKFRVDKQGHGKEEKILEGYANKGDYNNELEFLINGDNSSAYIIDEMEAPKGYKKVDKIIVKMNKSGDGLELNGKPEGVTIDKMKIIVKNEVDLDQVFEYNVYYYVEGTTNYIPGTSTPYKVLAPLGTAYLPTNPNVSGYVVIENQPNTVEVTADGQAKVIIYYKAIQGIPETPETPEIPETPGIPETPETPETPEIPETPETPEIPETPGTPETPETPEISETPEIPEIPETPEQPIELSDNLIIKHYTKIGNRNETLALTVGEQINLITDSIIVFGEDFKNSDIINQGFRYQSSSPESITITADVTSGTALEVFTFELHYYKDESKERDDNDRNRDRNNSVLIDELEVPLAELEKVDHFAYVIGYIDGTIKPENNITREEVAMIFYRLLTDEDRTELLNDSNPFTDIDSERWSNKAISTLYKANVLKGYEDGEFKPTKPITRAEFAAISARFDELELSSETKFTDTSGHWAEKYINSSTVKGWIKGYEDNTFRPETDITRAESMALINNVLGRGVTEENIHPDAMLWIDNTTSDWYFEAVMEATNSHDYLIDENNLELWTGMKANKVWP